MSKTYKVLIAGMGKRGQHHASAFAKNPRFEVTAISDPVPAQLDKAKALYPKARAGADAAALAKEAQPDIFCFCTPPHIRLPLIKTGIASGAKLIAYEKPMAMSMSEAIEIRQAIKAAGIKTVVSHQHRYGEHYQKVGQIVASGALGHVHTVYATATGWMMHMLSHLIEYSSWYAANNEAKTATPAIIFAFFDFISGSLINPTPGLRHGKSLASRNQRSKLANSSSPLPHELQGRARQSAARRSIIRRWQRATE